MHPVPSALTRAALLVAVEGALVLVTAAGYAVAGAAGAARDAAGAELGALLIAGTGTALLLAARGLRRRRRWARGPVMAVQLVAALVAVSYLSTPVWPVAAAVVALAVLVVGHLLSPSARRALDEPA